MPVPSGDVIVLQQQPTLQLEDVFKLRSDTRDSISSTDSDVSLSYDDDGGAASPPPSTQLLGVAASELSSASDSEGCKDSGCEAPADEDTFVAPDEQLAARIVQQVEFYFSDVNITKDAFLLKHVKRNKEGYVSLKLISSFKRVKHLAKDWRVVAHALATGSRLLQVNEAQTKLRRIAPLPRYDDTAPSRTVVALELPLEKPTIESVVDLFAPCGKLALVRILRPGNPVPADVRPFVAALPELATAVCALVEFEDADGARCALDRRPACAQAAPLTQWAAMRVLALTQNNSVVSSAPPQQQQQKERKKRSAKPKQQRPPSAGYESACASDAEFDTSRRRSSTASSVSSCRSSPLASPLRLQNIQMSPLYQFVNAEPYVPRRQSACYYPQPASPLTARPRSNTTPNVLRTLPENVLRLPRGPDGTKGFRQRLMQQAARARSVSTPVCPSAVLAH
ncbi:la-related protein 6 [Neocloeon triangulifer]|uniref:la-related protein 6 n=1 Tax=Neocloeon triangulifer TaxID=2078957 RepID=UPI00286F3D93|nr:la-related protein 6 [Neocloeon triangulifer]